VRKAKNQRLRSRAKNGNGLEPVRQSGETESLQRGLMRG
jgi:hypothetical protein